MNLTRQQVRELSFQALFALEVDSEQDQALLKKTLFEQNAIDDYFNQLVAGVLAIHKDLEAQYLPFLKADWPIDRISKTANVALQIGIFELKNRIDIPKKSGIRSSNRTR